MPRSDRSSDQKMKKKLKNKMNALEGLEKEHAPERGRSFEAVAKPLQEEAS